MRMAKLSGLAILLSAIVTACQTGEFSSPSGGAGGHDLTLVPGLPTSNATLACSYTPSGVVAIGVATNQTFAPTSVPDCAGAYGVLTPTDSRVGFGISSPCASFEATAAGSGNLFKVRRCVAGNASLNIYTSSSKTTLLQTISIRTTVACSYAPSGAVVINIGATQTFAPTSVSDCAGAYGVLTPTDGRVGFGISSPCASFETTAAGSGNLFKVRRCAAGNASLNIYTNSSKTTLLQTISIPSAP